MLHRVSILVALILAVLGPHVAAFMPTMSMARERGDTQMVFNFGTAKAKGGAKVAAKDFTITVKQRFYKDAQLKIEGGAPVNLRKTLMANGVDVYPLQGEERRATGSISLIRDSWRHTVEYGF